VTVGGNEIDVGPQMHMSVDHEGTCETSVLVEVNQVFVGVPSLLLVDCVIHIYLHVVKIFLVLFALLSPGFYVFSLNFRTGVRLEFKEFLVVIFIKILIAFGLSSLLSKEAHKING
jgi:hypothetical protein